MKKLWLVPAFVLSIGLSTSAFSQVLWQSAETGMNTDQVKDKFPSAERPRRGIARSIDRDTNLSREALLEIPNYKIGTNTFNVKFIFSFGALDAVSINNVGGSPEVIFDSVRKLLETQYGEPIDTSASIGRQTIIWNDKGTTIKLTCYTDVLYISYEADEKDDSLSPGRLAYESYRAELKSGERKKWDLGAPGFDMDIELALSNESMRKRQASTQAILEYQNRQPNPKIGMNKSRIRFGTNWGAPEYINTTIDSRGSHEQWVYKANRYLYFDNDKLTSIQY